MHACIGVGKTAAAIGLVLFFGTFFLVGGGPPPGVLPDALNSFARWTPTGLLVEAIRAPWTGQGADVPSLLTLSVVAVFAGALAVRRLTRSD